MKTITNNNTILPVRVCEGSEGSEGIGRCVTSNILDLNKEFTHDFLNNTHIEIPSQPSHPHIYAQMSVRVKKLPSHTLTQQTKKEL
jgi:hypothetical protein